MEPGLFPNPETANCCSLLSFVNDTMIPLPFSLHPVCFIAWYLHLLRSHHSSCKAIFVVMSRFSSLTHTEMNINNAHHSDGCVGPSSYNRPLNSTFCHNDSGSILPAPQLYLVFVPFLVKMNNREFPYFSFQESHFFLQYYNSVI